MTTNNSVIDKNEKRILLEVNDLKKHFTMNKGLFSRTKNVAKAVDGVCFTVYEGETLALVGESGCGKTTTGKLILRLMDPTSGSVKFKGRDLYKLNKSEIRKVRRQMQIVFQDPSGSLNQKYKIKDIIGEALLVHKIVEKKDVLRKVEELLQLVGLQADSMNRYPHEFSGGQKQRIGIARALALGSQFIVCDEPVSALDVSIQSQVINLLEDLQKKLGLTYLFISHDLSVVRHISNRVAVMYLGNIVELANTDSLYSNPLHPYTNALLSAAPIPDPEIQRSRKRIVLEGDPPSLTNIPTGCRFHPRCPFKKDICLKESPELRIVEENHQVACHFAELIEKNM